MYPVESSVAFFPGGGSFSLLGDAAGRFQEGFSRFPDVLYVHQASMVRWVCVESPRAGRQAGDGSGEGGVRGGIVFASE